MQIPGLFGEDGLQPVSALLSKWRAAVGPSAPGVDLVTKVPTLVWFHADLHVLPETVMVRGIYCARVVAPCHLRCCPPSPPRMRAVLLAQ